MFGWLQERRQINEPRVLFCPSEQNDKLQFSTPTNPWPPGPTAISTANVFSGYGARPETKMPDPGEFPPDPVTFPNFAMPRLSKLRNKAIFADLANCTIRINTRHKQGLNVLYGNGSARWVRRDAFEGFLVGVPDPSGAPDPQYDPNMTQVWEALDRQ